MFSSWNGDDVFTGREPHNQGLTMSTFDLNFEASQNNFTLQKMFTKVVKAYRSGSSPAKSTPLGKTYKYEKEVSDYGYDDPKISLDETFSNNPSASDMKKKGINALYKQVINGDNYVDGEEIFLIGKAIISTGNGDDIIDVEPVLTSKTKSFHINAGKGDDVIGCNVEFDDYDGSKMPKVSFKGGKGSDIFFGVPEDGLTGYVKDFDIKKDILGFNADQKMHRFYEVSQGLAIVDMRKLDGVLILEGVDSIDQVNTVEISVD